MKYILDTDTLIYFFKGHKSVSEHISRLSPEDISITIINHAELMFGAFNSGKKQKNFARIENFLERVQIIPFCTESSLLFAEQKALLRKQGNIIEDLDLMIASIALLHQSTLVTNNTKHFERIKKLKIENWL